MRRVSSKISATQDRATPRETAGNARRYRQRKTSFRALFSRINAAFTHLCRHKEARQTRPGGLSDVLREDSERGACLSTFTDSADRINEDFWVFASSRDLPSDVEIGQAALEKLFDRLRLFAGKNAHVGVLLFVRPRKAPHRGEIIVLQSNLHVWGAGEAAGGRKLLAQMAIPAKRVESVNHAPHMSHSRITRDPTHHTSWRLRHLASRSLLSTACNELLDQQPSRTPVQYRLSPEPFSVPCSPWPQLVLMRDVDLRG